VAEITSSPEQNWTAGSKFPKRTQFESQLPMTSYRQIEANGRKALKRTGSRTEAGKESSRRNAVRHGLTAETVITALEDAEDYQAFEAAMTADYDAQSTVERELVLRLASILWRLRRATTIETGLFKIQAEHLRGHQQSRQLFPDSSGVVHALLHGTKAGGSAIEFAQCFLRPPHFPDFRLIVRAPTRRNPP